MRTATFHADGELRLGIVLSDRIYDAMQAAQAAGVQGDYSSLRRVLERPNGLEQLKQVEMRIGDLQLPAVTMQEARLEAPIMDPPKVLGVALNYRDFCARGNLPLPERLKVFGKYATAVNRHMGEIDIQGRNVTYEGELAVVIGKTCRRATREDALSFVAGYTAVNDCTANDYVKEDVQLMRGKNLDGFLPMGPVFVTADEIGDAGRLMIRTEVDGEVRQNASTEQMIFDIRDMICYFSSFMTLEPGDVIASGTPEGTALQFNPPRFLKPGQTVCVTVEKIGTLKNTVITSV